MGNRLGWVCMWIERGGWVMVRNMNNGKGFLSMVCYKLVKRKSLRRKVERLV